MTIELRQLRYFVAVAEELSFTGAARRLHVSQPPVSRQIALLETEVGVRLLLRTKQSVALTEAGSAFLERARAALDSAATAIDLARRAAEGKIGKLSIAYGGYSAHLLPKVLSRFRSKYPSVELALEPLLLPENHTALLRRSIDVCLVTLPLEDENIATEPFVRQPMVVCLPADHPLCGRRVLSLRQLAEQDFVMFPWSRGSGFGRVAMQLCSRAGFVPHIVQEAGPTESALGLVAAGVGIALLPSTAKRIRFAGVEFRALRDGFAAAEVGLAWRKADPSSVLHAFLGVAREERKKTPDLRIRKR